MPLAKFQIILPNTQSIVVSEYLEKLNYKCRKKTKDLIPENKILKIILIIRGENVILDSDLAALYGVETRRLNEQVRRNKDNSRRISCSN